MTSLDFLIFGNGFGLAMPYFDGKLYWLVDMASHKRDQRNGRFYHWIGGFGAQLGSFEWRAPLPGTRRRLAGYDFEAFSVTRRWRRHSVSWALVQRRPITREDVDILKETLDGSLIGDPPFINDRRKPV